MGNVLSVVNDRKIGVDEDNDGTYDRYEPVVMSATDYYPFGLDMNNRTYLNPDSNPNQKFRFGFNGKEKDENDEWGSIGHYDYGARVYNPSIGRFLSIDPMQKKYPELSPYHFTANNPIIHVDPDGGDHIVIIDKVNKTITIRAKFYTETKKASKRVQKTIHFLNDITANFIDEELGDFTISFDLEEQLVNNAQQAAEDDIMGNAVILSDKLVGEGNSGKVTRSSANDYEVVLLLEGKTKAFYSNEDATQNTAFHEILHIFGVDHKALERRGQLMNNIEGRTGEKVDADLFNSILNKSDQLNTNESTQINIKLNGSANPDDLTHRSGSRDRNINIMAPLYYHEKINLTGQVKGKTNGGSKYSNILYKGKPFNDQFVNEGDIDNEIKRN